MNYLFIYYLCITILSKFFPLIASRTSNIAAFLLKKNLQKDVLIFSVSSLFITFLSLPIYLLFFYQLLSNCLLSFHLSIIFLLVIYQIFCYHYLSLLSLYQLSVHLLFSIIYLLCFCSSQTIPGMQCGY